jgi:hypothetical protein
MLSVRQHLIPHGQTPCGTGADGADTLAAFVVASAFVAVAVDIVKSEPSMKIPPRAIFLSIGIPPENVCDVV